jgi:glycosyl transferase family 25
MLVDKIPVIYINLERRTDRNTEVIAELEKVGVTDAMRFKAIELENPALGCSMSHLKCLEIAKQNNYESVLICEDDIQFLNPQLFLTQLKVFLKTNTTWDVALIAGNNMIPYLPVNFNSIKICNCQTTTGYIVKSHYYDTLIQNYKEGIRYLLTNPDNTDYRIDKYWFHLQRVDNWFLVIPLTIVQREGYSDIEKRVTNFNNYMLDYNKAYKSPAPAI